MNHDRERNHVMGRLDVLSWRSRTTANASGTPVSDDDLVADVEEPPERHPTKFSKSAIRVDTDRSESLLSMALKSPDADVYMKADMRGTDMVRRRSMMSNVSLASASTAELTSDGGLTSPSLTSPCRTDTPSPTFPSATYTTFAPFSFTQKMDMSRPNEPIIVDSETGDMPHCAPAQQPKKRCITFACADPVRKEPVQAVPKPLPAQTTEGAKRSCSIKFACPAKPAESVQPNVESSVRPEAPRRTSIKFACTAKPSEVTKSQATRSTSPRAPSANRTTSIKFACPSKPAEATKAELPSTPPTRPVVRRRSSRSPSVTRRGRQQSNPRPQLRPGDSSGTVRRVSKSPAAFRAKPKFLAADEQTLKSSEATRFHEFASEEVEEDDWIRRDEQTPKARLTINDTLEKENAIRKLGSEAAEEEAEEEAEEDEDEADGNDSEEEDDDGDVRSDASDFSDGNESDNEAGFAESDDESDPSGDFTFWTPGNYVQLPGAPVLQRPRAVRRKASDSSIDSLEHRRQSKVAERAGRPRRSHRIKIRPGTPELPDSTDFVCGTLDEDRPIEDAYVSCMNQRKSAKHVPKPQDIDPSFPTSDIEDEEDEDEDDYVRPAEESDEPLMMLGKFEDSGEERQGRRPSVIRHKSPGWSPRRLHSPPPPKRLHSPPPPTKNRLRLRSPAPRAVRSAEGSVNKPVAIRFTPMGARPDLTHTKSLPRAANLFCKQYRAARLAADDPDNNDAHLRGAIDIKVGLEQKRQRRREKWERKNCNRAQKPEKKPQPGKGAERMRKIGLFMAGQKPTQDPFMLSA